MPQHRWWKIAAVCALTTGGAMAGTRLAAQASARAKPAGRAALARGPAARTPRLSAQQLGQKLARIQAHSLRGLILLFEYDPDLSRSLDLDDNGEFLDNGDRVIQQGTIWLSDRSARLIRRIGSFSTESTYLDVSGEDDGTDLTQTVDMFFAGSGQVRAGGYWNVDDGVGSAALGIHGATGTSGLRVYRQGQLIFLSSVSDTEELYFLAR